MRIRRGAKDRRAMTALIVAVGLALGVGGCSGGGGDDENPEASVSATAEGQSDPSAQEGTDSPLAELKGEDGLLLVIDSAERDAGGFLTVSGEIKNDGAKAARVPIQTRGDETEIMRHGGSLGGATLVDPADKKRYYVLRDTDGRPLTTTDMPRIKPGASIPVFMQFPAPPTDTAKVTFQLPTFASAPIEISG
ncbi:hypothetical protein ACIQUX_08825 [Streptomyces sp. NPDC101133]|uniref:hypothetical protein n=1 Tax=Streptomyces sp. NPDC101133 TaxID=3366111 RepID=UPI00382B39E9